MNCKRWGALTPVVVSFLLTSTAWAGGAYLNEVGSDDVGLASAGYASRAQDATNLFTNPAGMTRLEHSEPQFGVEPIYLYAKFSPNSDTSAAKQY